MQTNIQPVTFFRSAANILRVQSVSIAHLGQNGSARVLCSFIEAGTGRILSSEVVDISGDAYAQWGSDDEYVLDYAVTALGLTKA